MPRTDRTIQRAREIFLAELGKGLSITGAAQAANLPRRTVYDWREADAEFKALWDDAVDAGADLLEDEAFRRAFHGVPEPVTSQGRLQKDEAGVVITVQKYSDTLMTLLLKGRRPTKYRERVSQELSGPDGTSLGAQAPVTISIQPIPSGWFFDADGKLIKDEETA